MDYTLIIYGVSLYLGVLAMTTVAYIGTWEIQAEALPPYLTDQGYTTEIFVNQVVDEIHRIRREVATQSHVDVLVGGHPTPASEVAQYFGLAGLIRAGQTTIGVAPPVIEIEVIQKDQTAHWRLRGPHALLGPTVATGSVDQADTDQLLETVAHKAMAYLSPFEASAYDLVSAYDTGDYGRAIDSSSLLLRECNATAAAICTAESINLGRTVRGLAYLNGGHVDAALEDLTYASEAGGGDALANAFLGDVYKDKGETATATAKYAVARAMDPTVADTFVTFGRGLAEAGYHRLAVNRYETAQELGAAGPEFLACWADSLIGIGELEQALGKYQEAEGYDPTTELYEERIDEIRRLIEQKKTSGSLIMPPPRCPDMAAG